MMDIGLGSEQVLDLGPFLLALPDMGVRLNLGQHSQKPEPGLLILVKILGSEARAAVSHHGLWCHT